MDSKKKKAKQSWGERGCRVKTVQRGELGAQVWLHEGCSQISDLGQIT